jgi:hypothetical protein
LIDSLSEDVSIGEDASAVCGDTLSTSFVNDSFAALYAPDIVSIIELDVDASFAGVSTSGNELSIGEIVFVDVLISDRGSTLPNGLGVSRVPGIFILGVAIDVSTLPDGLGVSTLPDIFILSAVAIDVSTLAGIPSIGVLTLPVIDTLSAVVGVSTLPEVVDIFALLVAVEFGVSAPPNMLSKNPPPFIFGTR